MARSSSPRRFFVEMRGGGRTMIELERVAELEDGVCLVDEQMIQLGKLSVGKVVGQS